MLNRLFMFARPARHSMALLENQIIISLLSASMARPENLL